MTTVVPISQYDDRLEHAIRWIMRMDEGLSADEWARLKAWLSQDPRNAAELIEVAQAWDKLDSLARLGELFPIAGSIDQASVVSTRHAWMPRAVWLAAAASVAIVALTVVWLASFPGPSLEATQPLAVPAAVYETAIGEQKTVLLPDGTEVVLNTNSRLDVSYSPSMRALTLLRGEIHVEVADNPSRPLSVVVGDRIVQAVGTAFRVEITEDQTVELMVTEGKVVVGVHRAPSTGDSDRNDSNSEHALTPPIVAETARNSVKAGEKLVLGASAEVVMPVSDEEIEVELSWREGRLIFRGEPLEQVLTEVERYTTVEFVFLDEELRKRSVRGRYRAGDVEALLLALRANFNIAYEYQTENRVLLSSL